MSKQIFKLKVPIPGKDESFPEFVSHGNLEATLVRGELVETSDPNFARHLEQSYGLTLESVEDVEPEAETTDETEAGDDAADTIAADEYPEDFPARDVLIGHNVAYETAIGLDADQLKAYKGIGPKLAGEIVEFVANGGNE